MSFLQSPEWEQFQSLLGRKTWRADGVLVVRHDLPGGLNYLYSPRPNTVTSNWLLVAGKIALQEKSIFLKIDPAGSGKSDFPQEVRLPKMKVSSSIQPRKTIVLDFQKSEDELLGAMHEKTRYNIRLAERKSVEVSIRGAGSRAHDIKSFWGLLKETAERDRFHTHPQSHYERLLSVYSSNFSSELFFAECNGKIIAAAMVNFYRSPTSIESVATYLHGASRREYRDMMAPHLLHWRIIQEAKRRGFRYYDLWGIDEKKWPGLTRFKTGFGGEVVEYPPSADLVYRPFLYGAYCIVKQL